ncbi:MAG: cbb3-type cytochrome c oxidase subunit 3 [Pseudomonadota bacterium]
MSYEIMRVFAGSWGLVFMFTAFALVIVVTLRPGSRKLHRDIAEIPFRHDDRPASEADEAQP